MHGKPGQQRQQVMRVLGCASSNEEGATAVWQSNPNHHRGDQGTRRTDTCHKHPQLLEPEPPTDPNHCARRGHVWGTPLLSAGHLHCHLTPLPSSPLT